jgi:eukaryotic-like serine/threonine-protein kinase
MAARATERRLSGVALPDRYKVLHHVADGGMASVWCTHDDALGRDVAIKLLAEAYARDGAAVGSTTHRLPMAGAINDCSR